MKSPKKGVKMYYNKKEQQLGSTFVPSWRASVKTVGDSDITELLVDFPPLLECLKYMIDCTFS